MSCLAYITIHQCDGCRQVVSLKTDAEYREFERSWYDGFKVDFCPFCFGRKENSDAILADQALRAQITARVDRLSEPGAVATGFEEPIEEAAYGH